MSQTTKNDRRYTVYCQRYDNNGRTICEGEAGRNLMPMTHEEARTFKSKMPQRQGWHYHIVEIQDDEMGKRFEQAKAHRDELEAAATAASTSLKQIPGIGSGPMGLTPDSVKQSAEYRKALTASNRAFARLQRFNRMFVPAFAKQIQAERKEKEICKPATT